MTPVCVCAAEDLVDAAADVEPKRSIPSVVQAARHGTARRGSRALLLGIGHAPAGGPVGSRPIASPKQTWSYVSRSFAFRRVFIALNR